MHFQQVSFMVCDLHHNKTLLKEKNENTDGRNIHSLS